MIDPGELLPTAVPPLVNPGDLRSWIIFENEHLLVLNKPGWLVCQPSKQGPWSSLVGAVREEFKLETVRLVYRLDRETSGVITLAKSKTAGARLQSAAGQRKIGKTYAAILQGELTEAVTVNQPLGPDPSVNVTVKQRVVTGEESQEAVSDFSPLVRRGGYTLAAVRLRTGRKHQIRAHAEWMGLRVVGDKLYGPDPSLYLEFARHGWTERHSELLGMTRQALHCATIDLRPTGMDHVLHAPWPHDMARFAEQHMGLPAAEAQKWIDDFCRRYCKQPDDAAPAD